MQNHQELTNQKQLGNWLETAEREQLDGDGHGE
jgi:hypothetical protein